jgi:hypothetical protein
MKHIFFLLCLSIISLVGCTTIGQQITNHSGTIQIEQQNVPLNAQAAPGKLGNIPVYPVSSNLRHYSIAPLSQAPGQIITNTIVTYTNITNTINNPQENKPVLTNNIINENNVKKQETNNVTVNVYTEAVNIKQSSFLSDMFNYFLNE